MIKTDEKSNAQSWELEITCKNKKYLQDIVKYLVKDGRYEFEVNSVEIVGNVSEFDGRYIILIWCSWFNNLALLSRVLKRIENKHENK